MIVLKQRWEIGVCGNSLFLNGMAASLKSKEWFRVSRLDKNLTDALPDIKLLCLHAVLFEYTDAQQPAIAALLREQPGIKLIGLEAERNSLVVFSGSEHAVTSMEELMQIIVNKPDSYK